FFLDGGHQIGEIPHLPSRLLRDGVELLHGNHSADGRERSAGQAVDEVVVVTHSLLVREPAHFGCARHGQSPLQRVDNTPPPRWSSVSRKKSILCMRGFPPAGRCG